MILQFSAQFWSQGKFVCMTSLVRSFCVLVVFQISIFIRTSFKHWVCYNCQCDSTNSCKRRFLLHAWPPFLFHWGCTSEHFVQDIFNKSQWWRMWRCGRIYYYGNNFAMNSDVLLKPTIEILLGTSFNNRIGGMFTNTYKMEYKINSFVDCWTKIQVPFASGNSDVACDIL